MLLTAIKATLGIAIILGGWVAVQAAWRRVFPGVPADEDVLADRLGCHQCPCEDRCERLDREQAESGRRDPGARLLEI